jgi:hypothetical protein
MPFSCNADVDVVAAVVVVAEGTLGGGTWETGGGGNRKDLEARGCHGEADQNLKQKK